MEFFNGFPPDLLHAKMKKLLGVAEHENLTEISTTDKVLYRYKGCCWEHTLLHLFYQVDLVVPGLGLCS